MLINNSIKSVLSSSAETSWRSYTNEKTKNELKQSRIEALKDEQGPIVVDWDDGLAVQNEDEVKRLVDQLVEKNASLTGKRGGNGCIIV